ncbi:MAG: CBS domain-containing protein [Actinomycetota bacterium]
MSRDVLTIAPSATLQTAASAMSARRVGGVVVVAGDDVIGILTERDLLRAASKGLAPWEATVEVCMTPDPVSIAPGLEISQAAQLMLDRGFRHLPVLTGGALAGIVSLRDLLRAMEAERTVRAQERERLRMAADMHDGLAQHLISLWYRLQACERRFVGEQAAARAELKAAKEILDEAMKESRTVIYALRPGPLDELGLARAIDVLAHRVFPPEVEVVVACTLEGPIPPETEQATYRISQELLHNVRKHAKAHRVELGIASEDGEIRIVITDDGKGFDAEQYRRARPDMSFGLAGIGERAESLGGWFRIDSEIGQGARISVGLPLEDRSISESARTQSGATS